MSNQISKPIRSPSYPSMPLREAVLAVGKIEAAYRSSPVDRVAAAKLVGYNSLSGPANMALASMAAYGLLERAGKGETRVTERAKSILHPDSDAEKKRALKAASMEPQLFRELQERFPDIVPPEDGVVTYLNRQGFNPSAVKPAAKAFLQTMAYMEELGATKSHGSPGASPQESERSGGEHLPTYGGAHVGDLIQWEANGVLQLPTAMRVRHVHEDGEWVFVDGSETGIPMDETIVQEQAAELPHPPRLSRTPPILPLSGGFKPPADDEMETDLRLKLGGGVVVKVLSKDDLGFDELDTLVTLLSAQRDALKKRDG